MISEADIEKAVDYLRDSAIPAAKARAERLYMEQWIKTVKAEEMKRHVDMPLGAQEREAQASTAYMSALAAYQESIQNDEKCRFLREAASARIEAFRTLEATRRAEGRAYS